MKAINRTFDIRGINIACSLAGDEKGAPVLILHGAEGAGPLKALQEELALSHRVILPSHPGFDESERPDSLDTMDELAYFYLDLMDQLKLQNVKLIGFDLGGWLAAEIAVRSCQHIRSITLVDAVGIKVSPRDVPDIADVFTVPPETVPQLLWHDPQTAPKTPTPKEMSEEELELLLRNQEMTTLYTWKPFMHNPRLLGRLHRIQVPTLVIWGESDGVVSKDYGKSYAEAIPQAKFEVIEKAGHYPHLEQTERFHQAIKPFLASEKEAVTQ